jgi:carboxypeptidase Taq
MASSAERDALSERLGELADLGAAGSLVGWDRETVMPPGGAAGHGEILATLERLAHERLADPELGRLLEQAAERGGRRAAIARVVRRDHDRATRIPAELTAEMARATAAAIPAWVQARATSDFATFRPQLERQVQLAREVAACFPEAAHPYDALLEDYEPGATTAELHEVFARLESGLVPLVEEIAARPAPPPLPGPFPESGQRALAFAIAGAMGFDAEHWRMDDAVHPFASAITPADVRVTSRWDEADLSGLLAVMHEVGHGLYEAGVDPALARTTLDSGVSMGIHESQSRLWENQVGRSLPFWRHWHPRAQELLPALGSLDTDALHRALNVVRPTLIRVEADEATYTLHVILRFELEVALVEGTLDVADVPQAWNDRMRELLGVEVPDAARGCLQDVHWAHGSIGYFPTYALGNVFAAQLWEVARRDLPELDEQLEAGDCAPLLAWLREHVHRHGRLLDPPELVAQVTGGPLDPGPVLAYLTEKYGALYGIAA